MKCSKCKDKMYLYSELSSDEKQRLDEHLSDCEDCSLHFQRIMNMDLLIEKAAKVDINYPNSDFLTSTIMDRIELIEASKNKYKIRKNRFMIFVKYTMAVISFGLAILFYAEVSQTEQIVRNYPMNEMEHTSKLTTLTIKERIEKRRAKDEASTWKNCIRNNENSGEVKECIKDYLSLTIEN